MAIKKVSAIATTGLVTDVHDTQQNQLGARVQDEQGNEYVYLLGVANTAANSVVTYNATTYQTALIAADAVGKVAVAMAATVAGKYGWYLIYGFGSASSDTVAAAGGLFIDGTAGRVDDQSVAGDFVNGMVSTAADTSNVLPVHLTYPYVTNTVPA